MLKAIMLDLDGVVLRGKELISGVKESIENFNKKGIEVFILSNNSTMSRKELAKKLFELGLDVKEKNIYLSSYATAKYVKENYKNPVVFTITSGGIDEEMRKIGIELSSERADVVAVGLDYNFNYEKLVKAFRFIKKGAEFIAANVDPSYPIEDGFLPGSGAIVKAIEYSTGIQPKVIGKPNSYMLEMLMKEHHLKKEEVLMVGDRAETDIKMANNAGIRSALIFSGISKDANAWVKKNNLKELYDFLLKEGYLG